MRLGRDLIGKQVISIDDGRLVGTAKDIYLNSDLYWLTGIFLGTEGVLRRKNRIVHRDDVVVFGLDAILVKNADVVLNSGDINEAESWVRLEKLRGRGIDTPGGTKLATVGDVILNEEGKITGFSLSKVFVEGPIEREKTVLRASLIDTGSQDSIMTVDLPKLEQLYLNDGELPEEIEGIKVKKDQAKDESTE